MTGSQTSTLFFPFSAIPAISPAVRKIFKDAVVAGEAHAERMTDSVPHDLANSVHQVYDINPFHDGSPYSIAWPNRPTDEAVQAFANKHWPKKRGGKRGKRGL